MFQMFFNEHILAGKMEKVNTYAEIEEERRRQKRRRKERKWLVNSVWG